MSYTIHQVNFNGMDVSTEALIEMLRGYVEDKDLTTITNKITELTTAIETKASTGHKHEQSDINNLGQALAGKLDVGQHDYSDIIKATGYIISLFKQHNGKDEYENNIVNKFGYYKESLLCNLRKLNSIDDLDWMDDFES